MLNGSGLQRIPLNQISLSKLHDNKENRFQLYVY